MRNLLIGFLVGISLTFLAAQSNELNENQKLKAENLKLKTQYINCQLLNEQAILINDYRKTLKASENQEFDWTTLTFKPEIKTEEKK